MSDCVLWTKALNEFGYGVTYRNGRTVLAHRLALSDVTGVPIETPLYALHSCDNPPCVNPEHLRWGTQADNSQDMVARGRTTRGRKFPKTTCVNGHDLTDPANVYVRWNGARRCRPCTLETNRRWRRDRAA